MIIHSASFVSSSTSVKQCPRTAKPEFGFIGRSNVGKSSLVNLLTGNTRLAKISGNPGKTRTINHFLVNESWYLVDLPGYGYARIAMSKRKGWDAMVREYLESRDALFYTFLLVDARLEPQAKDLQFIDWLGAKGLPFCLVFTKTDKLSKNKLPFTIGAFQDELKKKWEELPPIFITSSQTGAGKMELLSFIDETNRNYAGLLGQDKS